MSSIPNHICSAQSCARIIGGPSTGKTEMLVRKVGDLLSSNEERIAVACASPAAAEEFARRLARAFGKDASRVDVRPARAFVMDVLAKPQAIEFTGREPRLLTAYEIAFLMEDMKTSGLRPRRLKGMLKFFYRTWSELGDWEDGWLLEGEESGVHDLLKKSLSMVRGILEPEAANLAVSFLLSDAGKAFQASYDHMLVDDYQNENRATQIAIGLMASKSLTVAGDPNGSVEVYDSYPYAKGLSQFASDNDGCTTTQLDQAHHSKAVHEALSSLVEESSEEDQSTVPSETATQGEVAFASFATPPDEFEGVSRIVREAIESGIPEDEIFVAAPNKAWVRNVALRLEHDGTAASALSANALAGDVRDREKCGEAMLACALRLVADPADEASWRAWCGFGDYLAHSNGLLALRERMENGGLRLHEALAQAERSPESFEPGIIKLIPAWKFGMDMASECSELGGNALFDRLADLVEANDRERAAVSALCKPELGGDAAAMSKRLEDALFYQRFGKGVRVGPIESLCGHSPRLLVLCGFIDGFIPCRAYFDGAEMPLDKQERERARLAKLLATMLSKSTDRLVFTYFEKTDLETAERMRIRVRRIRLENGVRTALTSRSVFAEDVQA